MCIVIAANKISSSGSLNLILHEHGHAYDQTWKNLHGNFLSGNPDFLTAHSKTAWKREYFTKNPDEALAESIASYFHSTSERNKPKRDAPEIHKFIQKHFESQDF